MSRRNVAIKRSIVPDPKFKSVSLAKFINHVMKSGKKTVAQHIVYGALETIKDKTGNNPVEVFERAIKNVAPMLEVKSRRVGGATYPVPIEVPYMRGTTLAMRWIRNASIDRSEKGMQAKLAAELLDAAGEEIVDADGKTKCVNVKGTAVKKRDEMHRMAEANKAFAHFVGKLVVTSASKESKEK